MMLAVLAVFVVAPLFGMQETKQVGQYTFTFQDNAWVMTGLPQSFEIEAGYACMHNDDTWNKWYNSGDDMLRQILDLGPNIVFKMKSSVDGQEHIFSVSEDGKPIIGVMAGTSGAGKGLAGLSTAAKVGLGVAGAGAAALIISNADDDDEASKAKR